MSTYLTNDKELTAIANAIREKNKTSSSLTYPTDFINAIEEISTGIDTSDSTATANDILNGKTAYAKGTKITGNIPSKSFADLTVIGATVIAPAGYYSTSATKTIGSGLTTQNEPTINSSTGLITATATVTTGYQEESTKSNTLQLATQEAQIITPGTSNQIITAGRYLIGAQTIAGDANLTAANIAQGVSIFGVTGTHGGSDDPTDFIENRDTWTSYENLSASKIGAGIFGFCHLSSINFPVCTSIGSYAFYHCDYLPTVSFSVCTSIGNYAFGCCSDLTTVNFPACTSIGISAFYNCYMLITISFPVCKTIGNSAFCNCYELSSVSFPACTNIGNSAFAYCNDLLTINFPVCTSIGNNAFANCYKLSTVSFPVCTSIGSSAFSHCSSLTTVHFPECTSIGMSAFYACSSLTSINFPKCTKIGSNAFAWGRNLTTASFPACTNIDNYAFDYCINLISLYLLGSSYVSLTDFNAFSSTPIGGYSAFAGQYGSIYVPASMLTSYKTRTNWTYFSSRFIGI